MPDIDFEAIVKGLQAENERLRLHILKMRNARNPLDHIDFNRAFRWIERHYVLLALGALLLNYFSEMVSNFLRRKSGER